MMNSHHDIYRLGAIAAILALFLISQPVGAASDPTWEIQTPPYTRLSVEGMEVTGDTNQGRYRIKPNGKTRFPLLVTASGPLGGTVKWKVKNLEELKNLKIIDGVITDPNPDPKIISILPKLCPRLENTTRPKGGSTLYSFFYNGRMDHLNHIPSFQLMDPDATQGKQPQTLKNMDGQNVLLVQAIRITNDYEDARIVKYKTKDPKTGKEMILKEGKGGFYANIQYAAIPYAEGIQQQDPQTILHLAQGNLKKIGKENLQPEMRTRSFLPGPFFSKNQFRYDLCEWGDTAYQMKEQSLNYKDLALWDWDFPVGKPDRILLIVWEGDEEHNYEQQKLLPPNYLIDDLIGVFDIKRENTLKPLTLKNPKGDFEITVVTGNMKVNGR